MVYLDTSVIVKLYIKEEHSISVSNWVKQNDEAILLTMLHELEFTNALQLKRYRLDINQEQVKRILSNFKNHKAMGIYYHPEINWPQAWHIAIDLSQKHTFRIGSRSMDILHIASAIAIHSKHFFTLDERQAKLASAAGMKIVKL